MARGLPGVNTGPWEDQPAASCYQGGTVSRPCAVCGRIDAGCTIHDLIGGYRPRWISREMMALWWTERQRALAAEK